MDMLASLQRYIPYFFISYKKQFYKNKSYEIIFYKNKYVFLKAIDPITYTSEYCPIFGGLVKNVVALKEHMERASFLS